MIEENIGDKIENKIKVFIIVSRRSKKSVPEEWYLGDDGYDNFPEKLKVIMTFKSRREAEKWIKYWNNGEERFDILERYLN